MHGNLLEPRATEQLIDYWIPTSDTNAAVDSAFGRAAVDSSLTKTEIESGAGEYRLVYGEPKRPPVAYFLYTMQERSKQIATAGYADAAKILKGWKEIDDITCDAFQKEAGSLKAVYERQLAEYSKYGWYKMRGQH